MSSNRLKVEVNALKEGMYVSDLDRPWHETPFPLQGFYIRLDDDIKALTQYCKYVYIDIQKQKLKTTHKAHSPFDKKEKTVEKKAESHVVNLPPIVIKSPKIYRTVCSIHKEVSKAAKLHRHVYEAINHVFASVSGDSPSDLKETVKETEKVAEGMVESVIRNPDALVWLAKMNDQDAYSYQLTVKASIWSLVFGRHLGLDKSQLKSLAMGVLLAHIGKAKLSQEVLDGMAESNSSYQLEYQKYIQHSLHALSTMNDLPKGVISIVEFHQERHNGTGFPKGVTGEKIPLLAKIAGLIHYYQELISPRNNDLGLSPLAAVSKLYELRNISFQQDLIERFIEAVGVFPTGTLVELSSNEVGIVTGHNQDRRLLPKVMIVLDEHKQKLKHTKVVDLKEKSMTGKPMDVVYIKDSLPKGAYNINENQYLLSGATSKWSWQHIAMSISAS
ncbi:MAG: HD-GYP domain-containing protein (c-di-GMP phosphodiesterase class II) [Oleiphilaceae bacterium]|jgi:HD-GYP domain-containing protein (c-di-GMP phosphodiesterase class II)